MAFKATYVGASTFTVSEDRTGEFVAGRKILADCGDDGKFISEVTSSSYDSGSNKTTVNIYDSVLTSNLSDVWYGVVSPGADGSLPIHDHSNRGQGGAAVVQSHGNEKHSSSYLTDAPTDGKQYARERRFRILGRGSELEPEDRTMVLRPSYRSEEDEELRLRSAVEPFLAPGDRVDFQGRVVTVQQISYYIAVSDEQMETVGS